MKQTLESARKSLNILLNQPVPKNEHDLAKDELRSLEAALHLLQDDLKIFQKDLQHLEKQLLDSQLNKDETKIPIFRNGLV